MEKLKQHIKSFVAISDADLSLITDSMQRRHYAKKDHLLQLDAYAQEVFFVLKGCARTYILDYNGIEHNISFSMEDWWLGDLQSFIHKTPASYSIQALEDSVVLAINQRNWDQLIETVPSFVGYTRLLFRNTMFAHERRILHSLSLTADQRYAFFLEEYPQLSQRISQKHIASYLGITPEFLSMLRKRKQ